MVQILFEQWTGQHHIADAQRRRDGFGKGAQIDDPSILVQALQRWNRAGIITELAVVIVLDDVPAFSF